MALESGLKAAEAVLSPGRRLAVIGYHSLEDRIVKHTFRRWKEEGKGQSVHKKIIAPQREEVLRNPSARSAKLRLFERAAA